MNLVTFPLLCLTILIQQSFCQEEGYEKLSCELEEIQQYIVDRHNHLRSQTEPSASNMLKMEWCPEAAENARRVAECCEHSHSKAHERQISIFGCGENLYMANRPHSWEKVIQGWWDECKDFEHGHGAKTAGAVIGHYTQAAWYRSFLLGCWMSYCPNQKLKFFYVCHYCPPRKKSEEDEDLYNPGEVNKTFVMFMKFLWASSYTPKKPQGIERADPGGRTSQIFTRRTSSVSSSVAITCIIQKWTKTDIQVRQADEDTPRSEGGQADNTHPMVTAEISNLIKLSRHWLSKTQSQVTAVTPDYTT
ncbi:cysteine-rich venom protein TEL1-like [Leptodactylus fuscus]|uniref:cysteine-rich venom protein TEL1-like n=1 Tax=Leptodactylus fuscus TaxID=238119 RepID=UPI003F4E99A7